MKFNPLIPWKKEDRPLAGSRPSGDPLAMFHRRIDNMFDDLFGSHLPAAFGSGGEGFAPHIDLSETDKEVRITAELPGLDENDVEVTLADNVVTLKGEKKQETRRRRKTTTTANGATASSSARCSFPMRSTSKRPKPASRTAC
jgi:HSP20 family protein